MPKRRYIIESVNTLGLMVFVKNAGAYTILNFPCTLRAMSYILVSLSHRSWGERRRRSKSKNCSRAGSGKGNAGKSGFQNPLQLPKHKYQRWVYILTSYRMNDYSGRLYPVVPHKSFHHLVRQPTNNKTMKPTFGNLKSIVKNSLSSLCPWSGLSAQWHIIGHGFGLSWFLLLSNNKTLIL